MTVIVALVFVCQARKHLNETLTPQKIAMSTYARCFEMAFEIQAINQRAINMAIAPGKREEFIDEHAATELASLIYERIVRKK